MTKTIRILAVAVAVANHCPAMPPENISGTTATAAVTPARSGDHSSVEPADKLSLVEKGRSSYSIVLPAKASAPETRAAKELQRVIHEMSGASLPIRTDAQPVPRHAILLGTSDTNRHIKSLGLPPLPADLGEDGFVIRTKGRHLVLGGNRPRGTLYAVYGLLEDQLGCRWYTEDFSRIPRRRSIELPTLDIVQKPAFEYREPFYTEAWGKDWAARNRCNGHHQKLDASTGGKYAYYPWAHSFFDLLPPKDYATTHPEYYSEIDGKRVWDPRNGQLCLTNPDVLRLSVARVDDWITSHPEAKFISLSQNDNNGYCLCVSCKRVIEEEGSPAGPLLRFVNNVARQVGGKHPDVLIDTLAYSFTERPPAKEPVLPNVRIRMAPIGSCTGHPIDVCPRSAKGYANLLEWSKKTNNLYIWHYNTDFRHYLLPFPDLDELQGSLRAYQKLGVKGVFCQGAYPPKGHAGELAELRSWVLAKLLWDPQRDIWQLTDEFLDAYYGKAAKPMRSYLDLLHKAVKDDNIHFRIRATPTDAGYLRKDLVDRSEALFDEAERAVKNDKPALVRVRKARLSIDYVRMFQATDDTERRKYARIVASKIREFNITQLREGEPAAKFLKRIEPSSGEAIDLPRN